MPYSDPTRKRESAKRYRDDHAAEASARTAEWKRAHPERVAQSRADRAERLRSDPEFRERANARTRAWRASRKQRQIAEGRQPAEWLTKALQNARYNAKSRGIEFALSAADFPALPEFCPYFPDTRLDYGVKSSAGARPDAPSFDRIDSARGYLPGNVEIVSCRANWIKNEGTWQEHQRIADRLRVLCGLSAGEASGSDVH